jgi:pyruvate,water dikinase
MSTYILRFTDDGADAHAAVGGKGANLSRLTTAGFPVPAGFTVTTDAYATFLDTQGLRDRVIAMIEALSFDRADELERVTAEIRALICSHELPPQLTETITSAYAELGEDVFVAVRSSGTAEDLSDASFAGLHDTYLDIRGADAVLDAVRRCWASLWTARAASYRNTQGFASTHGIAVVVQRMVASDVSGVMFTANPMTAATDEIVIDSSWGLGEAIVSGITTPDEFTVSHRDLRVKDKVLGSKEKQVIRDPVTGAGTVEEEVPAADRERFTLTDDQVAELADLGRRVQHYYGEFPQDTEWGCADGSFFLLQARPVTGVELSWDADCEDWQWTAEADDDTVWTRSWADEVWTGAITPLMYSCRCPGYTRGSAHAQEIWGHPDLAMMRLFRYHRGGGFYNADFDAEWNKVAGWPQFRPMLLANIAPTRHREVLDAPFSPLHYLKIHARCLALDPSQGVTTWWDTLDAARGPSDEEWRRMSDDQLKLAIQKQVDLEVQYIVDVWSGFMMHFRDVMCALATMVGGWYTGANPNAFIDLITGAPEKSAAMIETDALWDLALEIRASDELRRMFAEHEGRAFFDAARGTEAGREWLAKYEPFLAEHGHRGHADRDLIYTRRAEDPGVDYRALQAFLAADAGSDPAAGEVRVEQRRQEVVADVRANIRSRAFGGARVAAFDVVLNYIIRILKLRDDQRHYVDRLTFAIKRGFLELSRRCHERGYFQDDRDVFFLTRRENFEVLDGIANMPLAKAKIAGRRRNFDRLNQGETHNPMYLVRGRDADHELLSAPGEELPEGMFRGMGTSNGQAEGTARVVKDLGDIGRVRQGEILIVNATDPGWTPVFLVVAGIVVETGGMLAHASCLSREYGMPCVHLPRAMSLIPDGARVRIDGDTGAIELVSDGTEIAAAVQEPVRSA